MGLLQIIPDFCQDQETWDDSEFFWNAMKAIESNGIKLKVPKNATVKQNARGQVKIIEVDKVHLLLRDVNHGISIKYLEA